MTIRSTEPHKLSTLINIYGEDVNSPMAPKRETAQEIWGTELARALDTSGMTGRELADVLNVVPSTVSNWINGRRTPHVKDVERIEAKLGTNGYLKRGLKWVSREVSPEWAEWQDVEDDATELLSLQGHLVSGLLQTPEYAAAILPSHEVDDRLERQRILDQDNPPYLEALLDESVLYRRIGSAEVMAGQLNHLAEMTKRDNIAVRIVPFDADANAKYGGPFVLATLGNGSQIAFEDAVLAGRIMEGPAQLAKLRRLWSRFGSDALSRQSSLELIQRTISERWSA